MKETLHIIIENLVDDKQAVSIKETVEEKSILFEVTVAEADMGKVIGKQGKIAQSIRNVMKAVGTREHKRVSVEFVG